MPKRCLCSCWLRSKKVSAVDLGDAGKLYVPQLGSTEQLHLAGDLAVEAPVDPPSLRDLQANVKKDRGRAKRIAQFLHKKHELLVQDEPLTGQVLEELRAGGLPEKDCQWLAHVAGAWTEALKTQVQDK